MLELAVKSLIAYLLGAILGALILGVLIGVDIRTQGSGNAGGTNALRTQGKWFALGVMLIDVGKGWCAVAWLPLLAWPTPSVDLDPQWLRAACALAVTLGHIYPVWFEFRGGKGVATVLGVVIGLSPVYVLPVLGIWAGIVLLTGFVSLGSMLAVSALPIMTAWRDPSDPALISTFFVLAVLVIFAHRANVLRLFEGTESRLRRWRSVKPSTHG
jgi:glycerol-3-phosphate acyltransferase PlsY